MICPSCLQPLRELQWERISILEALANAAYGRRGNGFVVLLQKSG